MEMLIFREKNVNSRQKTEIHGIKTGNSRQENGEFTAGIRGIHGKKTGELTPRNGNSRHKKTGVHGIKTGNSRQQTGIHGKKTGVHGIKWEFTA